MKVGYPCINRSIGCQADKTFRLASYSEPRLIETVQNNLACLERLLTYNADHRFFFFRIASTFVPFASHEICKYKWAGHFAKDFYRIGRWIRDRNMRISMHPDQFTLLNAVNPLIVSRSIAELTYHAELLDAMGLDRTAKIQIHVGGLYNDRVSALERFVTVYKTLPEPVRRRLVIENDERLFSLSDCLALNERTGVPILFDTFHHSLFNHGESYAKAFEQCAKTWTKQDGLPMVDYSSQHPNTRMGRHSESLDAADFAKVIKETRGFDFDVMLEIKDKEASALRAVELLEKDARFAPPAGRKKLLKTP